MGVKCSSENCPSVISVDSGSLLVDAIVLFGFKMSASNFLSQKYQRTSFYTMFTNIAPHAFCSSPLIGRVILSRGRASLNH